MRAERRGSGRGGAKWLPSPAWWLVAVALAGSGLGAQGPPDPAEIVRRSQEAFLAAGQDMRARVTMRLVDRQGRQRLREMTMLRLDLEGGEQRYFIYFHQPAEVRDMAFLVWKHPGRGDDRWLFVPAIDLVRRVAADDSRASFAGSDFTYEDVSGRDLAADTHTLAAEAVVQDRPCYVVESVPGKGEPAEFTRKVSWIDKERFLPLKEEYYDRRGELYRVFTADEVRQVGDFPTVVARTMRDVKREHRTQVRFESVEYDVGLTQDLFTERYLRQPPAQWLR